MWALSDQGGGEFQRRGSFCESSQALLPRHWNLSSVVQVMPLSRRQAGKQPCLWQAPEVYRIHRSKSAPCLGSWCSSCSAQLLQLKRRSRSVPRFHCHPMEERNQCTHFPPLHKSVCAWLHGDFPSLLLGATVPCPLPPPKGTLSPTQLVAMCFINEHHGRPGLAACTPCCLHPRSQGPGMALVRQAGPAGPGDRAGQGFVALCWQLSHHIAPHTGLGRDTSRSVRGMWQRAWEVAGTTPGLLFWWVYFGFWGFWAELFISQVRGTCCLEDCPSSGSEHSSSRLDVLLVSECEWR